MFKLPLENIDALFARIAEASELFAPIKAGKECNFSKWSPGARVDLHTLKTDNSPKDIILPQSEEVYSSRMQGQNIAITAAEHSTNPFIVFGVKACDIKAVDVLDNIYLKGDFVDEIYKARRTRACIVSLACSKPAATCFCAAFGIDAAKPKGDVSTWLLDGYLYFEAQNDKGEEFVGKIEDLLEKADSAPVKELEARIKEQIDALPFSGLEMDAFKPQDTMKFFNSEKWDELYKACLGCGACTYICPTCSCYDIRDYQTKCGKIQKFRCWDSCMFPEFTLMAHGNNRNSQKERFRQRFMHKLMYHNEKFDEMGCVGCGRCVNKCPANLNIIKVIKSLGGVNNV